jgi:hypothetical protein
MHACCVQISLLQRKAAAIPQSAPLARQYSIESTALLLGGIGWSAPPLPSSKRPATDPRNAWTRWKPQTAAALASTTHRPQTPIYQPSLADALRPSRSALPPISPPWSAASKLHTMFQWPAHLGRMQAECVSPCEHLLLTAARKDGSVRSAVRSWHLQNFAPGAQYLEHLEVVRSMAIVSASAGVAASVDAGGALHFWRLHDASQIAVIQGSAALLLVARVVKCLSVWPQAAN